MGPVVVFYVLVKLERKIVLTPKADVNNEAFNIK